MALTRRQLIGLSLSSAAALASVAYLKDESMSQAPIREGKVLCDFHAHPCKNNDLEDLVAMLGSPGLVGLAGKFIDKSGEDILLYEEAVDLVKKDPTFYEITHGQLAKFRQGYFARTQEIQAGVFHVLGIGFEGDYMQPYVPYGSVADVVHAIHAQKGIAVLNHPFFLSKGGLIVKPATAQDLAKIKEAYALADEIEVHNAFCIDLVPGIIAAKKANTFAQELLSEYPAKIGMAGSDCHRHVSQAKICGNYINQQIVEQGMDFIKDSIQQGNFARYGNAHDGPYVNRGSWVLGVAGDIISTLRT